MLKSKPSTSKTSLATKTQDETSHLTYPTPTNSKVKLSGTISSDCNDSSTPINRSSNNNKFIEPFISELLTDHEIDTLINKEVSNDFIVELYSKIEPFLISKGIEINNLNKSLPSFVSDYFSRFLKSNLNSGKRIRTIIIIRIVSGLLKDNDGSIEQKLEFLSVAFLCSFLIELIQMSILVADDVMDSSLTRRKKKCWYLDDSVGLAAINDAMWGFTLSNLYFKRFSVSDELSLLLINALNELKLRLCCGQGIDGMLQNYAKTWFQENLIFKNFELVTQYKTTFYTFYYPCLFPYLIHSVFISSYANNPINLETFKKQLETYTSLFGLLFGAQDDYLDVFGDYAVSGKIGSDIEEGKCTFLLIKALEQLNSLSFCYTGECELNRVNLICSCSERMKELIRDNIGVKNTQRIKMVKEVFIKCGVEKLFDEYKEEVIERLKRCKAIDEYPIVKSVLDIILDRIKSRKD